MNINWDEKPDWAIGHAVITDIDVKVWFDEIKYQYVNGGEPILFVCGYGRNKLENEHYPPETKSGWNGEGLPPVGTVCEVLNINTWHLTKIIGYDNGLPVFKVDWSERYCYACGEDFKFSPLKSDKEKWIDQAVEILSNDYTRVTDIVKNRGYFEGAAVVIYEALISGELLIPEVRK